MRKWSQVFIRYYLKIRDPLGRSDCVDKALLVTETTDSISLSTKSATNSLSGDKFDLFLNRVECVFKSLSLNPL